MSTDSNRHKLSERFNMKEYTLRNFHVCDILPFVHCYKPPVSSTAAAIFKKVDLHLHEEDTSIRIYLMSTTSFSFPTAKDIAFNLCRENFPPGKRYEVTITYIQHRRVNEFNRRNRNISFNFAGTCINPKFCIIFVYPAAYLKTI